MVKKSDLISDLDKDEIVHVQIHEKDLQALIHLLNITHDTYNKVVDNAFKQGDDKSVTLFGARAKLAFAFSERLNQYLDFAEPSSKERH